MSNESEKFYPDNWEFFDPETIKLRQAMNTKDTIQKDAETGHTPQVFGFDGFGINGCDLYASRLATLTEEGHKQKVGHLLAAAPELLDWIKSVVSDRVLTESKLTEGQQLICKVGNKS